MDNRTFTALHIASSGAPKESDMLDNHTEFLDDDVPRGQQRKWDSRKPYKYAEIVKIFLSQDANPMATTNKGWTVLHLAAEAGDAERIKLLKAGCDDPEKRCYDDLKKVQRAQWKRGKTPFCCIAKEKQSHC